MIPVRENSEVVGIYPYIYIYNHVFLRNTMRSPQKWNASDATEL